MSDILIRNMKIPKNCLECPCFQFEWFDDDIDGYCKALKTKIMNRSKHHPDCPLVDIPTPHGRLIDADAIQDYNVETFGQRLLIIDTAPTVIEAEGETE